MVVKGPENEELAKMIEALRRDKAPFWKSVARILAKPRRKRVAVNVSKIDKYAGDGDVVVVPGKVLGDGDINKPVVIAAFSFSKNAEEKIKKAGGKVMSLEEGHKELKDFKDVVLLV